MSDNEIKISIIVPCYKVEKYLPRCLDSLVNQTLSDIEIICINDGSPDNCLSILKEYQLKYGERIAIIDKENAGLWFARLDGIRVATGKYIGFVDSDDYVAPDFAEKLFDAAERINADIAVCGFDRIDIISGNLYSREMTKFKYDSFCIQDNPGLLLEVNTAPWNKIFRADLLKNLPQIDSAPKVLEDIVFSELAYIHANTITFINRSLVYYMVRKDSIINTINSKYIEGVYKQMVEVRSIYCNENPGMLDYIDSCAFLHLGISFMYRLSADKELDYNLALKNNRTVLDECFPNWKNEYISLRYVVRNHNANKKILIGKVIYEFHLYKVFVRVYTFMIDRLGVDIKW